MNKLLLTTLSLATAISLNATTLATVNGHSVTEKDINALMQSMQGKIDYKSLPADTQKKLLNQAIERKLLISNAIKSGVERKKEYKEALKTLKNNLALDVWMKGQFSAIKVSESDAKKYYKENGDKFVKPARTKARHILVKTEDEAKKIISELKGLSGKKLEDKFIALAKKKSTGPSATNGGQLGWFGEKQMVPAFSKAAFSLRKGEITTKPVKTQFGYHIILNEGKESSKKADFKDVKEQIRNGLKMEKFRKTISAKAKSLVKKADVKIK